jgi:Dyp-type peroxidase family
MSTPNPDIEFKDIQGNIFGGFNKDQQVCLLMKITDAQKARATFQKGGDESISKRIENSSSALVLRFNNQFKALRRQGIPEGSVSATWTNMVFTNGGLQKLGAPMLEKFPKAFVEGMAARAGSIGDLAEDGNDPGNWNDATHTEVAWAEVDVMLLLASDDATEVDSKRTSSRLSKYVSLINAADSGLQLYSPIHGQTRVDEMGHEHFGFKDGVSQPGIRGVTPADDSLGNPNQGNPGQDLLHAGEFVLGYPRQIPHAKTDFDGPNPDPGIVAGADFYPTDPVDSRTVLPEWTRNGSFLVFRRLAQDVGRFRGFVSETAAKLGVSEDLLGAKLVGRYRSGAPLEKIKFDPRGDAYVPTQFDPAGAHPALAANDSLNNDFEFGNGDEDGHIVPRAAHIRKAYPRDEVATGLNPKDAESMTQTHRLLRRGIPFGNSWSPQNNNEPRGLLFFAYQSDIERQFEFVQKFWVNNQDFPQADDGQDPIIAQSKSGKIGGCPFHHGASAGACTAGKLDVKHFIKTRGGGYFFSPSISALNVLLGGGTF